MPNKPGRPPIASSKRRSERFTIPLTKSEIAAIRAAGGVSWARELLIKASRSRIS